MKEYSGAPTIKVVLDRREGERPDDATEQDLRAWGLAVAPRRAG
jgi:hypothetical protein